MKKHFLLLSLFFLLGSKVFGQYVLDLPDDSRKVVLNKNGTWQYLETDKICSGSSYIPKTSTKKYTSLFKKYAVWYNPYDWKVDTVKTGNGISWDAYFYSKDYAISAYCMESRLTMPVENMEKTARQDWEALGEITSYNSYKDTLNGMPVTRFGLLLTSGGVTYKYQGYVYSSERGSFQFTIGTQQEIFEEDKDKIEQLLKGFQKL